MKHEDIKTKLDALGDKYRASDSVSEREKISTDIRTVQVQLQDELSKGAKPCPDGADHRVIGMLKRPGYYDGRLEIQVPEQWEVGCITCPPVLVQREKGVRRWSHSARGATPKEAVQNWNAGTWVEDGQVDRVPSKELFRPEKSRKTKAQKTAPQTTKADALADDKIDDAEGTAMGADSQSPVEKAIRS